MSTDPAKELDKRDTSPPDQARSTQPMLVLIAILICSLLYFVIYHRVFPPPPAESWEAVPLRIEQAHGEFRGKQTELGHRIYLEDRIVVTYSNVVMDLGSHEMGISEKSAQRSQRVSDLCWKARKAKEHLTFVAARYQHEGIGVLFEDKPVYILKKVRFREEEVTLEDN